MVCNICKDAPKKYQCDFNDKTEFNLSEKRIGNPHMMDIDVFKFEDVKEFIRLLKFHSNICQIGQTWIMILDYDKFKELAGEKLK